MPQLAELSEELDKLLVLLGISVDQLAEILGAERSTVYAWLSADDFPQPGQERQRLESVFALSTALNEAFEGDGAASWLHSASGYFKGARPLDVLLQGDITSVSAALLALEYGAYI